MSSRTATVVASVLLVCLAACVVCDNVVTLTDDNFDDMTKDGAWLVKFYAPWCGHCKRLAPIFEEAAGKLGGKVRLGKVDCTVESGLASRFNVRGYPTVNFIRGESVKQYTGGRTVDAITRYCESMAGPAASSMALNELDGWLKSPSNKFVLLSTDEEDQRVFTGVAENYQGGSLEFAMAKDSAAGFAKALQVEAGTKLVAVTDEGNFAMDDESLDSQSIDKFVRTYQFPLVSEIGSANFRELTSQGVLTIIAVVNPDDAKKTPPFLELTRELARKNRGGRFVFAWINGAQWSEYVARFDITPELFPRMLALDAPANRFFGDLDISEQTVAAYSTWLDTVEQQNEDAKTFFGNLLDMGGKAVRAAKKNLLATAGFLALFVVAIYLCFTALDEEPLPASKAEASKNAAAKEAAATEEKGTEAKKED